MLTEAIINYSLFIQCLDNLFGQKPLGLENLKYFCFTTRRRSERNGFRTGIYLTEKLRYIIQMFGRIVSAC